MKNKSLFIWVFVTLLVVATLPFLLSWYQIKESKIAIIDQSQKSHMIISRATADRISHHIDKYVELTNSLGNNPIVYLEPDSAETAELIKTILVSYQEILAIGLVLREDDKDETIQVLKKNNTDLNNFQQLMTKNSGTELSVFKSENSIYFKTTKKTARPNVFIKMFFSFNLKSYLNPLILGKYATLDMIDENGLAIIGSSDHFVPLSATILNQVKSKNITSSVNRVDNSKKQDIVSLANIDNTHWTIVSRQPTEFAELATEKIATTAWRAFFFILITVSLLLLLAYFSWVKPIRRLVQSYHKLLGTSQEGQWQGNEVSSLEKSFENLSKHMNDKQALKQVFVDRYQVISSIGFGGMGAVFLGWDPRLKRHVALKTLPIANSFASREDMTDTLVQEAITAAKISHSNVVSIYDVVSSKNTAFIAMEYVNGESLHSLLLRNKKLSVSNTLSIAIAIAKGLQFAHHLGFVHRDIKPENILLGINGDIKLTDFGTTVLLSTLEKDKVTGSPAYIAPEIYLEGKVSLQSDLFSLGLVLLTCLIGKNPFKGKNVRETKINILTKKLKFPKELESKSYEKLINVLEQILDKNPENRPRKVSDFINMIRDVAPEKIKWDPELAGVQSTKETIYAESDNKTVVNVNDI